METKVLVAQSMITHRGVGEEALSSKVGFDGCSIVLHLGVYTPQGVPRHGRTVALAVTIIVVGGLANEAVRG